MPRGRRDVDDIIIASLVCGAKQDAAAAKAGVSTTTVQRRLQNPKFRRRLVEARVEMVQRLAGNLTAASTEAVRTLLELIKSGSPAVKLGASRTILEIGTRMRESADLEQRVLEIEERLNGRSSS
jgi:hypothetical protein